MSGTSASTLLSGWGRGAFVCMDQPILHSSLLSRRAFVGRLAAIGGALGASLLAACQPAAPAVAPTSSAAKPAAPAATSAPAQGAATSAPAQAAATTAPAAAKAPTAAPAAAGQEKLGSQLIGKLEGPEIMVNAGRPAKLGEAPMLADLVKQGKLPPVEQRVPDEPL